MSAINPLVGGATHNVATAPDTDSTETVVPEAVVNTDGTEYVIAAIVLGALGVLILFRLAGFQAVIAASAKLGG